MTNTATGCRVYNNIHFHRALSVLFVHYIVLHFKISGRFFWFKHIPITKLDPVIHYSHHFKRPIKSITLHLAQTSHKDKRMCCRATRTMATRGSSESNIRSMRMLFFKKNSRVVLHAEEGMIYVDLINPLWWQNYNQMINGELEKQENYWCDL